MDLSNINSVSELVEANTTMTPEEKVIAGVREMEPKQRLEMAAAIISTLRDSGVEMTMGNINETLPESMSSKAAAWADDVATLRCALKLLNDVEL